MMDTWMVFVTCTISWDLEWQEVDLTLHIFLSDPTNSPTASQKMFIRNTKVSLETLAISWMDFRHDTHEACCARDRRTWKQGSCTWCSGTFGCPMAALQARVLPCTRQNHVEQTFEVEKERKKDHSSCQWFWGEHHNAGGCRQWSLSRALIH